MERQKKTLDSSPQFFSIVGAELLLLQRCLLLGSMLRAIGDTKTPMKIGIITNVLNVVVDYVLILV